MRRRVRLYSTLLYSAVGAFGQWEISIRYARSRERVGAHIVVNGRICHLIPFR